MFAAMRTSTDMLHLVMMHAIMSMVMHAVVAVAVAMVTAVVS